MLRSTESQCVLPNSCRVHTTRPVTTPLEPTCPVQCDGDGGALSDWSDGRTTRRRGRRPHRGRQVRPVRCPVQDAWAARWSTPTRCRSTAAWTSVRRRSVRRSATAYRITCSTSSTSPRPRPWPSSSSSPGQRSTTASPAGVVPVLAGGSALYVRAILDDFVFPGTDAKVRDRLEAELERDRVRRAAPEAGRGRPGRGRADPAEQRPADRPGAGGHRDHRRPVRRDAARASLRLPGCGPDRSRRTAAGAGRADRPPGGPDVRRGFRRRGARSAEQGFA